MVYISAFFDAYDEAGNGWLTLKQAKDFFAFVCDLNYKKYNHRKTFVRIMRIVDPEDNKFVLKDRVMDFFSISGFAIISKLCKEQMQVNAEYDFEAKSTMGASTVAPISVIVDDKDSDSS